MRQCTLTIRTIFISRYRFGIPIYICGCRVVWKNLRFFNILSNDILEEDDSKCIALTDTEAFK